MCRILGKEEDFEVDALGDWEPMEFMKDRSNVSAGVGVGGWTNC